MKKHIIVGIAAAAMALSTSSAFASLTFLGQISPTDVADVPNPISESDASAETGQYWNPFGSYSSAPWLNILDGGSATFSAPTGVFEFIWGSPNPGNVVTTNDHQTYTTSDLPSSVVNEPLGYLVEVTGHFTTVTLTMSGGDGGNFEIGVVPEPSTWAMMGLGFAGLAFAGYRSRRSAISIA